MEQIYCGDLIFNDIKYKFDFRNNILVIIPDVLEDYTKWHFKNIGKNNKFERVNVEGITNNGWYICFVHVKFSHLGRGILQAFVPGYTICKANCVSPLPKCEEISKIRFFGECLDRFYYPKRIIETSDFFHSDDITLEVNKTKLKTDDFIVNKDIFKFGVAWKMPYSSNINVVLDVESYLEIDFNSKKNIDEIVEYYLKVKKFFSFINNRKYIKFNKVIAYTIIPVNYGIQHDDIRDEEFKFEFYFVDPDEKYDLDKNITSIHLEDINNKFSKLYKLVTNKDFLTEYYPLSISDNNYVDNDKFVNAARAFESEFDKLYPKFKSSTSEEYALVKKSLLKCLNNKKNKANLLIKKDIDVKSNKKIIKECDYFNKIIGNIEGTLSEKVTYSLRKYKDIISNKKQILLNNHEILKIKEGTLADEFSKRRNNISHGNEVDAFTDVEVIAYELVRMCIYCITLKRCKISDENINNIVNKIF